MQDTRAHVRATFSDGVAYSWVRDVTAQVGFGSSKPTVAEVGDGGEVISMGTGTADIRAYAAGGSLLGSATVSVLPQNYVTVEDLHVLVPAFLAMSSLPSGAVDPAGGEAEVAASLTNQLQFEGQQVQARAVLILSDEEETASGSRLDVTGDPDLAWQTTDPLVGEMSPTGVITARGTGSAEAQATFSGAWGDVFTSTDGDFEVQLPPPTKVTLSIPNSKIARSTTDTAYTILGLPISRVITVTVHFADGTTRNMTSDLRTHLAVTGSLVTVKDKSTCGTTPNCVPGTVTSTGTGTGQVLVQVSFTGAYLSALTGIISVQVVGHQGLALTVSELYTPQGEESVPETTLSYIEGTSTRQRGRAKVVASFTDGSTSDVTSNTGVSYQVTSNLTGQPAPGALVVSSQAIVSGTQVGLWDLTAKLAGNSSPPVTLSVSNTTADLDLLSVTYPPGSTLLGVKGQEAGSLRVIGTFADGTRNLLTQEGLINGLLVFQSATPSRAAVSATGALTPLSNGPVTFTVDVAADASVSFNPPATRYLPVNLTPAAGDVDLGDATGLPFPDRDADEIFSLPVRVNTGTLALGGLDLRITYDPLVLEALDAKVGTPLTGGIFSANVSIPGTVFLNVTPPLSGFAAGPAVEVAVLTFRALKTPGGPSISTMGGSVIGFLDTGGATIGGGVPRFFIAGAGPLDPAP
ncbi:MAG: hypothetical protein FJ098_13250, partial [Deltaproteobacteria bacterium]|nr:hypothetical protein [Deltaproteobacteria bacterium]